MVSIVTYKKDQCLSIIMVSDPTLVNFQRSQLLNALEIYALKLINIEGGLNYNLNFSRNYHSIKHLETQAWDNSCPALLNGEFYMISNQIIFEDSPNCTELYNQKSSVFKIVNCGFELIDELSISFFLGSCGTFLFPEQRIFLCFGEKSRKKCFR